MRAETFVKLAYARREIIRLKQHFVHRFQGHSLVESHNLELGWHVNIFCYFIVPSLV